MDAKPLRTGGQVEDILVRYQNTVYGLALARTGSRQTQRMYFRRSFSLTSNQTKLFEMRNIKRHGCFGPRSISAGGSPPPVGGKGRSLFPSGKDRPLPFQSAEENSVWQAVMELKESLRVPIYLFYFQGLTTQEIARALSIRPGAVRMRLSRGRERLRQTLKGDYFDE